MLIIVYKQSKGWLYAKSVLEALKFDHFKVPSSKCGTARMAVRFRETGHGPRTQSAKASWTYHKRVNRIQPQKRRMCPQTRFLRLQKLEMLRWDQTPRRRKIRLPSTGTRYFPLKIINLEDHIT